MAQQFAEAMTKNEAQHVRWQNLPVEQMNSLLERQFVSGEKSMIARVFLKKGCTVPEHSHSNEQIAYVESGALQFTIGGKDTVLRAGEVLLIPPDLPHSATALEDTVDIDFFAPPRQDWLSREDGYLRG